MNLKQFAMRKTVKAKAERKTFWKDHAWQLEVPGLGRLHSLPGWMNDWMDQHADACVTLANPTFTWHEEPAEAWGKIYLRRSLIDLVED